MSTHRRTLAIGTIAILTLLGVAAWRGAPVRELPGPFAPGSIWRSPSGYDWKIEEVQGEWLRVSSDQAYGGMSPKTVWIYAPTGATWAQN